MDINILLAYAQLASVIASFALLLATILTVREMREARVLGQLPILTCEMHHATLAGNLFKVTVTNVGNAPAINAKIRLESPDTEFDRLPIEWNLPTLGPAEEDASDIHLPTSGKLKVQMTYRNAYNLVFTTIGSFEYQTTTKKSGTFMPDWEKLSEQTTFK